MTQNAQTYETQLGLFVGTLGNEGKGANARCAASLDVVVDSFRMVGSGPARGRFSLKFRDGEEIAAVMLGEEDLKRLALQIIMGLF